MRTYISVDLEGVAGVVRRHQVIRGESGYAEACRLMTGEANAAAAGAIDAGATEVLVNDSHGDMCNLVLEDLDPRVQVLSGNLKRFSMAEGVQDGRFGIALFVGYHGGMGTQDAILDHTYRSAVLWSVRVNGQTMNEAALNAMVAGAAGTPVGLVTGDASTCEQCRSLLPGIETVTVKWAVSRLAARSLHPMKARAAIREAAARVVASADRFQPFRPEPPYVLELDTIDTAMADAAAIMPGVERPAARTLRYVADDVSTLFRALLAMLRLGGTAS
ncbi:M55 family metallopeptidase [Paraliomyxa miuraensis]|uniref:M55 family metallopeptidase n=1 Tax=Paraliomyxa miuraensis TaxID=376150 RepID=UPI00224F482B|nr:M55 family metallopeptidase [Paraliomyxa miuraensis]MCX4246292.1 M55 family metallopeptidase [Paraliomyxa miuraensis]